MRLDKLLSNLGYGSRKEVHELIKSGVVVVNHSIIKKKEYSINEKEDLLQINGAIINTQLVRYIKFHKPSNCVTAVVDHCDKTVMDYLPKSFKKMKIVPVGRLDKDTEGLLFLTNDGQWAHRIIHGHKKVEKKYYFMYEGVISEIGKQRIADGLMFSDGTICKPAKLEIINDHEGFLTISEGKYHQVKRMIAACDAKITYLKRVQIGSITLQGIENVGDFTELSLEEIQFF